MKTKLDLRGGVLQNAAQDAADLSELSRTDGQRRSELDDGVSTVVGAAVEAGLPQCGREVIAQQAIALFSADAVVSGGLKLSAIYTAPFLAKNSQSPRQATAAHQGVKKRESKKGCELRNFV